MIIKYSEYILHPDSEVQPKLGSKSEKILGSATLSPRIFTSIFFIYYTIQEKNLLKIHQYLLKLLDLPEQDKYNVNKGPAIFLTLCELSK